MKLNEFVKANNNLYCEIRVEGVHQIEGYLRDICKEFLQMEIDHVERSGDIAWIDLKGE